MATKYIRHAVSPFALVLAFAVAACQGGEDDTLASDSALRSACFRTDRCRPTSWRPRRLTW